MSKPRLPESIRQFVKQQRSMLVADLWGSDRKEHRSPYGSYWCRAVACILLSGRVQAKFDGTPNMTDVHRVGKEANFNQYLLERVGTFLVAAGVIQIDRGNAYGEGPNLAGFWEHDAKLLPAITRQAVLRLVGNSTGHRFSHPKLPDDACLIEFLTLFFTCFKGLAPVETEVGRIFGDFIRLPEEDLIQAAEGIGIASDRIDLPGWKKTLNGKGQKALVSALHTAEWAYYIASKDEKMVWFCLSPIGLSMLGIGKALRRPELATVFKVQPDLSVFAGAGLAWKTLVPLFRHTAIKRIDQVYEFRLDRKRITSAPSTTAPGDELREVFRELEALPPTVADLLTTKSKVIGKVGIRWCSALVKPANAESLAAIRAHPKLKGYLEPGAPPGYLLIKSSSDPGNFAQRCQDLGFDVHSL